MARWLWIFWIYSFLGYGLEKLFAAVTHAPNQGRKCFLLLPLCPVYGLGMLAVLALPVRATATHKHRSEERRVGKECRSRWSPYH